MKELIERLKQLIIEQNNVADKNTIYEAIQVLTSVKSEQPNKLEINANPENGIVFYADSVKGNGLHFDSPSVKSDSAEDKKQHAIGFLELVPTGYYWSKDEIDIFYNEYLNTLNNK